MAMPSPVATAGLVVRSIQLACAAGGEQDRAGRDEQHFFERLLADDGARRIVPSWMIRSRVKAKSILDTLPVDRTLSTSTRMISRPGRIALGMEDPALGVGGFLGKGELRTFLVELGAPEDQLPDAGRPFLHQRADCFAQAEPVAGLDRIVKVDRDLVLVGQDHGHAALGVLAAALRRRVLGHDQHIAVPRKLHGGPQPGDAAADDEEVGL